MVSGRICHGGSLFEVDGVAVKADAGKPEGMKNAQDQEGRGRSEGWSCGGYENVAKCSFMEGQFDRYWLGKHTKSTSSWRRWI
jgi:hypothetical protein